MIKKILSSRAVPIILVCLFIYGIVHILNSATSKEDKQDITIGDNSRVEIVQGAQKKFFIPFIEIYGQTDTDREDKGVLRCGLRLEF